MRQKTQTRQENKGKYKLGLQKDIEIKITTSLKCRFNAIEFLVMSNGWGSVFCCWGGQNMTYSKSLENSLLIYEAKKLTR